MFILAKKLPLFFCSLNHNNRPPNNMLWINRSFYYCQNSFDKCMCMLSSIISDVAYNLVSRNAMPIAVVTPHGMVTSNEKYRGCSWSVEHLIISKHCHALLGKTECRIGREISNRTKKCRIGHRIWPLYSLIMSTRLKIKTYLTHKLLLHQLK